MIWPPTYIKRRPLLKIPVKITQHVHGYLTQHRTLTLAHPEDADWMECSFEASLEEACAGICNYIVNPAELDEPTLTLTITYVLRPLS